MEAEEAPCESVGVQWHWELAMTGEEPQWGAAYREEKDASGVHRQDSHTSPVVVDARGGQWDRWW